MVGSSGEKGLQEVDSRRASWGVWGSGLGVDDDDDGDGIAGSRKREIDEQVSSVLGLAWGESERRHS